MSVIDVAVVVGYLALMLVIGYFSGKDNESQEDYFLAKRSMPWIPIALSVAATMISANGFIGGPGWAYTDGMYPVMVNITVPLAIFFALWITTPVIYNLKVTSVYQYMELRMGPKTRMLAIMQFFVNSLIQVSSMVYIPVLIVNTITGWPMYILVPIVVIISVVYTLMGGIKAVIWTDTIQMLVVIGGVILVVFTAINGTELGFFETLAEAKATGKLNTLDFSTDVTLTNTFWAMIIPGAISIYNVIITRTYFINSIPKSLEEAAELDGANTFQLLIKVVLPLSKPILAVIGLYYAVGHWNDFYTALIYINDKSLLPLQSFLRDLLMSNKMSMANMQGLDAAAMEAKMQLAQTLKYSVIIVSTVPVLCIYPFIQKYFVKGVMLGSLKG